MKHMQKFQRKGFTLVEVMIVVVIVGLLAMLAVPAFQKLRRNSAGKAMIADAHNISEEMLKLAPTAKSGTTITLIVAADGALSCADFDPAGALATGTAIQFENKVTPGTGNPITYTFGTPEKEKAFSMIHPHCSPSDVAPTSSINLNTKLGTPVQFDAKGDPL